MKKIYTYNCISSPEERVYLMLNTNVTSITRLWNMWLIELIVVKLDITMKGITSQKNNRFGDCIDSAIDLPYFSRVVRGNRVSICKVNAACALLSLRM